MNANFRTLRCSDNRTYFERDELAERIYRFTYQFPVEFALLSLCCLIPMWNWQQHTSPNTLGKREEYVCILASNADMNVHVRDIISERSSLIPAFRRHRLMNLLKLCYQTALRCLSRHAVYPSVIFAACKFSSSALFDKLQDGDIVTDDNPQRSDTESVQIIIQTVFTYVLCTVAFVGFVLIRSERARSRNGRYILAFGLLVLQMFATVDIVGIMIKDKVDADKPEYIMYYIKHVLQFFEVYAQTVLFIRFRKMQIDKESMREGKHLVIKGMVVFVTVCNFERWMADRVLEEEEEEEEEEEVCCICK